MKVFCSVIIHIAVLCHLHDMIKFYFILALRRGEMLLLVSMVHDTVVSMCTVRGDFIMHGAIQRTESALLPLEAAPFLID